MHGSSIPLRKCIKLYFTVQKGIWFGPVSEKFNLLKIILSFVKAIPVPKPGRAKMLSDEKLLVVCIPMSPSAHHSCNARKLQKAGLKYGLVNTAEKTVDFWRHEALAAQTFLNKRCLLKILEMGSII